MEKKITLQSALSFSFSLIALVSAGMFIVFGLFGIFFFFIAIASSLSAFILGVIDISKNIQNHPVLSYIGVFISRFTLLVGGFVVSSIIMMYLILFVITMISSLAGI